LLLTPIFLVAQTPTQNPPASAPSQGTPQAHPQAGPTQPASNSGQSAQPANGAAQGTDISQSPDQDTGAFVFKANVEEVILHATVVDQERHLVTRLDPNSFAVFENNVPQKITSFHREDVPVAMGIVIDNSGSMRDKRDKVNEAVLNLLRASNPLDEIFIVNFSQDSYLDQDFTSNIDQLRVALQRVSMGGSTALYDAIVASSVHLANNTHLDNKVLLVITDGQDNASRETLREAAQHLQQKKGPTLYAIGIMSGELHPEGRQALQSLSDVMGGAAFFPSGVNELDDISRTIGHDIRSRYTIGYKSTNEGSTGYRNIRVTAQSATERQLTVRTRNGYYPGETFR
jgi:VWFA-related protein